MGEGGGERRIPDKKNSKYCKLDLFKKQADVAIEHVDWDNIK